jgi:hypothetical protein
MHYPPAQTLSYRIVQMLEQAMIQSWCVTHPEESALQMYEIAIGFA